MVSRTRVQGCDNRCGEPMKTPCDIRKYCLSFVMLALAWTAAASAAALAPESAPAAAQQTAQPTTELDEIWIHGKRLADRITAAEDEFFPIFNKVNKNDDYDIRCGYTYLSPDSLIMSRLCVPGFLGKDYGAPAIWGICSGAFPAFRGGYAVMRLCTEGGYEPPSVEFIVMAKSDDLRKNMTKVISSDPRLRAMAAHLGDLYLELDSVQQRHRRAKGVGTRDTNRLNPKVSRTSAGPRA
jgi:hypothetical protein